MVTKHHPTPEERDERANVPLPPEVAIPAFLAVDPSTELGEEPPAGTDAYTEAESESEREEGPEH